MHEVQKYVTLSNHGYLGYAVITNKAFWDGLPADIRATLEGAMKDATRYANDIAKEDNEAALAKVRQSGKSEIIELTPEQRLEWKKVLVKVHRQMEDRVGGQQIQAIYEATGCDCGKL
jgi:C4-dicarboxylate-binding protein DctP